MILSLRHCGVVLLAATVTWSGVQAQRGSTSPGACRDSENAVAGVRCDAAAGVRERRLAGLTADLPDGWRLVRAVDPAGGESVAVTRTAEMTRSDPDLAGIMLRCDKDGTSLLVVLLRPLHSRATPRVRLATEAGESRQFEAKVAPPGTAVRLPSEVAEQAGGAWLSAAELNIVVDSEEGTVSGVVSLAGLRSAWEVLTSNCRSR